MPKISQPRIILINRSTKETQAQISLPLFCLEHMKMGTETDNLNMMLKHLSSASKLKIDKVFGADGEVLAGLSWTQCVGDLDLYFD